MPSRASAFIRPLTLIRAAAVAGEVVVSLPHVPGLVATVAAKTLEVYVAAKDRAEHHKMREDGISELQAEMKHFEGDLIRARRFLERHAQDSANAPEVVTFSGRDAHEFRGLQKAVLGRVSTLETAVLKVGPYLTDDERDLMSRQMAEARGMLHDVLCGPDEGPPASQVGKILRAQRIAGNIIAGWRPPDEIADVEQQAIRLKDGGRDLGCSLPITDRRSQASRGTRNTPVGARYNTGGGKERDRDRCSD